MNVNLLYKDKDIGLSESLLWNADALMKDLSLSTIFDAMACENDFERNIAKRVILSSNRNDINTILYQQHILKDFISHPQELSALYDIVTEAILIKKNNRFFLLSPNPSFMLYSEALLILDIIPCLKKMKRMADHVDGLFNSEGLCNFWKRIQNNLTDSFIRQMEYHLNYLKQHDDLYCSAQLGERNFGINYTLHKPIKDKRNWWQRLIGRFFTKPSDMVFTISYRDESGMRALSEIRDECLFETANYLTQISDSIFKFLNVLQAELTFYKACLNLHKKLTDYNLDVCFPMIDENNNKGIDCTGLYDLSLLLSTCQKPVENDLYADNKKLIIITGANKGGKTTFLRSVGIALLLMNNGMFVPSKTMSASFCQTLLTHFKREEDKTMNSGKLDEELSRMDELIKHIQSNTWILFNESFAATNEKEGSEIAKQIVCALYEKGIKVVFVTHLYDFAEYYYEKQLPDCLCLKAERKKDATRTYKMIDGGPTETSYGQDIYNQIFNNNLK